MSTPQINQYIPAGSYIESSRDIEITLVANCARSMGGSQISTLKYTVLDSQTIGDIANENGVLTIHKGNGSAKNPNQKYSEFIPAGSYQNSSTEIRVEIRALCLKTNGDLNQARVKYGTSFPIKDIMNINGNLVFD